MFLRITTIGKVSNLDEAMKIANSVNYGLTAGFFGSVKETDWFFDNIEAGVTYANRPKGATTGAWPGYQPFGGWKGSGATGKNGGGYYYVQLYMHEQIRTMVKRAKSNGKGASKKGVVKKAVKTVQDMQSLGPVLGQYFDAKAQAIEVVEKAKTGTFKVSSLGKALELELALEQAREFEEQVKMLFFQANKMDVSSIYMDIGESDAELGRAKLVSEAFTKFQIPHELQIYNGEHTEEYWSGHVAEYVRWYAEGWNN